MRYHAINCTARVQRTLPHTTARTNIEIDDPATAVGALDAAAAAAATVLAALPTATPESTSGQMQISG